MGKRSSERGNVLEIVIIVILALAIVGLIVWRVMDSKSDNSTESSSSTSQSNSSNTTSQSNSSNTTQTDKNQGYIVIDEWNVRFKPADATSFTYAKLSGSTKPDDYGFSTSTLESMGKYCLASMGQKGSVTRSTNANPTTDSYYPGAALNGGNPIGGYYYFYRGPQAVGCTDEAPTQSEIQTETSQTALIKALVNTIEAKQ